jgi:hypothetical protein
MGIDAQLVCYPVILSHDDVGTADDTLGWAGLW